MKVTSAVKYSRSVCVASNSKVVRLTGNKFSNINLNLGTLLEFNIVPFGVTNGVPCFQQVMNDMIKEHGLQNTFAYLDNVTIAGADAAELERNDATFQKMPDPLHILL